MFDEVFPVLMPVLFFFVSDNIEMLKALYDFQAVYPKTISFDEGEYFILYQTSARQRNWWQVVSMKGNIGFVPSNYVMKIKVSKPPSSQPASSRCGAIVMFVVVE